jgi:photosystem II stability/assembly factor-like uncharacterized protein
VVFAKEETMIKRLFLLTCVFLMTTGVHASEPEPSVLAAKASQSLLLDIHRLSQEKLVAVGERGHILISNDLGESWEQVVTPTQAMLTAVTFVNEQIGYAVGHQQVILKTTDGGVSWELQHHNPDDLSYPSLFDVWFRDGSWGLAVGAYGLMLKTTDGGKSWEPADLAELEDPDFGLPHFYSLAFDGKNNRLYLVGELGFVAASNDFGKTWERLEFPYHGSLFHVSVSSSGSVQAMGLRGHLFRSDDRGESWEQINTGTFASINSMVNIGGSQLAYFAVDGVMLFSNDDGKSVTVTQLTDRSGLMAGVVTGVNQLVVVGEKGIKRIDFDGREIKQ